MQVLGQKDIFRINSRVNRDFRKIAILGQNHLHAQFWSKTSRNSVLVNSRAILEENLLESSSGAFLTFLRIRGSDFD